MRILCSLNTNIGIFFILLLVSVFNEVSAQDVSRAYGVQNGIMISNQNTANLVWMGAGSISPTVSPGIQAPLNSIYRQTDGAVWVKTGSLATEWTRDGIGDPVYSQVASFGKSGNAPGGSFLERGGSVPSNIAGEIITTVQGRIVAVGCAQEDTGTWSVTVYEHTGGIFPTGFTSLYTLNVVSSKVGSVRNLDIPVTTDKQLAVAAGTSVKNIGCTIAMKGLSL